MLLRGGSRERECGVACSKKKARRLIDFGPAVDFLFFLLSTSTSKNSHLTRSNKPSPASPTSAGTPASRARPGDPSPRRNRHACQSAPRGSSRRRSSSSRGSRRGRGRTRPPAAAETFDLMEERGGERGKHARRQRERHL